MISASQTSFANSLRFPALTTTLTLTLGSDPYGTIVTAIPLGSVNVCFTGIVKSLGADPSGGSSFCAKRAGATVITRIARTANRIVFMIIVPLRSGFRLEDQNRAIGWPQVLLCGFENNLGRYLHEFLLERVYSRRIVVKKIEAFLETRPAAVLPGPVRDAQDGPYFYESPI